MPDTSKPHDQAQHLQQLSDSLPILLMPVRIQTRFVRVKHLAGHIRRDQVVDLSKRPEKPAPQVLYDPKGGLGDLYSMPTYLGLQHEKGEVKSWARDMRNALRKGELAAPAQWFRIVPDRLELWVRFYPDDIFIHTHETRLTAEEAEAGQRFWQQWWAVHRAHPQADQQRQQREGDGYQALLAAWGSLQRAYQQSRAAWIFRQTMPANYREAQTDYSRPPDFGAPPAGIKDEIWTEPIRSFVLPDRFVLSLFQGDHSGEFTGQPVPHPLQLSPAPREGATLDEIQWAHDFDAAEKIGMAIRIPLDGKPFRSDIPFDKLVAIGVKNTDAAAGQALLEQLLDNHRYRDAGMAILPQGTPTNNFERVRSGYTAAGLPEEETFRLETGPPLFTEEARWDHRRDGACLAAALGIDPAPLQHLHHSDSLEVAHSLAMNRLLWPATLGYYLQQFLQPLIPAEAREKTREFFLDYVSGRGSLPVFRVGKQPYGILPATHFANWRFREGEDPFFQKLYEEVLRPLDEHWGKLAGNVRRINNNGAAAMHKFSEAFVQVMGLSAGSEAFYQRMQLGNYLLENATGAGLLEQKIKSPGTQMTQQEYNLTYTRRLTATSYYREYLGKHLADLGFDLPAHKNYFSQQERIFHQHFSDLYREFRNPVVDPVPPSGQRQLSKYAIGDQQLNYLEWLRVSTYRDLQREHFPESHPGETRPTSLLYILARQALCRAYIELAASMIPAFDPRVSTVDFEMEHLGQNGSGSGAEVRQFMQSIGASAAGQNSGASYLYEINRWQYLEQQSPESAGKTIGEFLEDQLKDDNRTKKYLPLTDAKRALALLEHLPTAGLQQLFSEHLDLCSYRLDGWMLGLIRHRLTYLRQAGRQPRGIYLGAYGYVENLDLKGALPKVVYHLTNEPETMPQDQRVNEFEVVIPLVHLASFEQEGVAAEALLSRSVVYLGRDEPGQMERSFTDARKIVHRAEQDRSNQGFLHAPSPAHAVTAALLRSGFLSNNPYGAGGNEFAVNLNSERVRQALFYLEGVRGGQELPALLGYRFERELHDSAIPFLDAYLQAFRKAFPLTTGPGANNGPAASTEGVFQVVHGLKLLDAYRLQQGDLDGLLAAVGIDLNLPGLSQPQLTAAKAGIQTAIEQMQDHMDAVSDLLLAESMFQVAKGNFPQAASVLSTLNNDKDIDLPEIIKTPAGGLPLSHLVGIQFDLRGPASIWAGVDSPRSLLNPGLNRWLAAQLPHPSNMAFLVEADGQVSRWSMRNLLLQPLDLLALFQEKNPLSETSALTYYIKGLAVKHFKLPPEAAIRVDYAGREGMYDKQKTLKELKPLLMILRDLINNSRPLLPGDLHWSAGASNMDADLYEQLDLSQTKAVFRAIVLDKGKHSLHRLCTSIRTQTDLLRQLQASGVSGAGLQSAFDKLLAVLYDSSYFQPLVEDYHHAARMPTAEMVDLLIGKGERAHAHYTALHEQARSTYALMQGEKRKKQQWESCMALARLIFGNTLMLTPHFRLNAPEEIREALDFPDLLADAGPDAVEEWLQGIALVRDQMKHYKKLDLLRSVFPLESPAQPLRIVQLPREQDLKNYRWLGAGFSPELSVRGAHLSLALELPEPYEPAGLQSGMIIDFWTERIQTAAKDTALAMHYNQPNSEPPQTLLLCVAPQLTGSWQWEDLLGCVLDSMERAAKRMVEPEMLEADIQQRRPDVYYQFGHPLKFILPGLSVPVSNTRNTPAAGLDEQNQLY